MHHGFYDPERSCTSDLDLRRVALYLTELLDRIPGSGSCTRSSCSTDTRDYLLHLPRSPDATPQPLFRGVGTSTECSAYLKGMASPR